MMQRLISNTTRINIGNAISLVLSLGVITPWVIQAVQSGSMVQVLPQIIVVFYLAFWVASCAAYAILTHLVFTRADAAILKQHFVADNKPSTVWERLFGYRSAVSFALQSALVSVIIPVAIAQNKDLGGSPFVSLLALGSVVGAWVCVAQTFALEYYEAWAVGESVTLEDIPAPTYIDFWNVSLLHATLFGTQLHLGSQRLRNVQRWQAIIALFFNTVIVAVLVTYLTR